MKRTVLLAAAAVGLAAPSTAHAEATFDELAAAATSLPSASSLVWALTATCDAGDDLARRQCRLVRDRAAETLRAGTLLVDVEPGTLEVGAWDVNKKSTPIVLRGCLACEGVEVGGKRWHVTAAGAGTGEAQVIKGGVRGAVLHETARTFRDDAAAVAWRQTAVPRLVTQLLVRVPAQPTWRRGGRDGLTLELVGYRVYDPCDGLVVLAQPAAAPGPANKQACAPAPAPATDATVVDRLTPTMISRAMQPARDASQACLDSYGVSGEATLTLVIGGDGTVLSFEQQGDFVDTPTGACIEAEVRKVSFPRSRTARTPISYPLVLR
ncbi:MAG: hypothetical protein R2939_15440 [Kofleriaceae bacterium]